MILLDFSSFFSGEILNLDEVICTFSPVFEEMMAVAVHCDVLLGIDWMRSVISLRESMVMEVRG